MTLSVRFTWVTALLAVNACSRQPAAPAVSRVVLSDAAIGFFVTNGSTCEWHRVDGPRDEIIATLPQACTGPQIAWSADGSQAIVAESTRQISSSIRNLQTSRSQLPSRIVPDRLWLMTASGVSDLATPRHGTIETFGFDLSGVPAVATMIATTSGGLWGKAVTWTGRDGLRCKPSLLTRQHHENGSWVVVNVWERACEEFSADDADYFTFHSPIGGRLPRLREFEGEEIVDRDFIARLDALDPWTAPRARVAARRPQRPAAIPTSPPWHAATTPGGGTIARREADLVFVPASGSAILPPDPPAAIRSIIVRGEYALVMNADGTEPRLYDLRTAAITWKSDVALAATFWPKPAGE